MKRIIVYAPNIVAILHRELGDYFRALDIEGVYGVFPRITARHPMADLLEEAGGADNALSLESFNRMFPSIVFAVDQQSPDYLSLGGQRDLTVSLELIERIQASRAYDNTLNIGHTARYIASDQTLEQAKLRIGETGKDLSARVCSHIETAAMSFEIWDVNLLRGLELNDLVGSFLLNCVDKSSSDEEDYKNLLGSIALQLKPDTLRAAKGADYNLAHGHMAYANTINCSFSYNRYQIDLNLGS